MWAWRWRMQAGVRARVRAAVFAVATAKAWGSSRATLLSPCSKLGMHVVMAPDGQKALDMLSEQVEESPKNGMGFIGTFQAVMDQLLDRAGKVPDLLSPQESERLRDSIVNNLMQQFTMFDKA